MNLDARTATAYGLLRAFVRYEITRSSGTPFGGRPGAHRHQPERCSRRFIQFGGLTAGRVTSFFSNADLPTAHMGTLRFDDAPDVDLLAYTFSFGNGFSATLSVEDGLERRSNGFIRGRASVTRIRSAYGGAARPDVVAQREVRRHLGRRSALRRGAPDPHAGNLFDSIRSSALRRLPGHGVRLRGRSLGASVNLPFLAPGDALLGGRRPTPMARLPTSTAANCRLRSQPVSRLRGVAIPVADAFINPRHGRSQDGAAPGRSPVVCATTGLRRSARTCSVRTPGSSAAIATTFDLAAGTTTGLSTSTSAASAPTSSGSRSPASSSASRCIYTKIDPRGRRALMPRAAFSLRSGRRPNIWEGRLRVQRDF